MSAKLPPYLSWRDGRPRFIPDAGVRRLGFAGEDLRGDPDPSTSAVRDGSAKKSGGAWLTFEDASAWGWQRYRDILRCKGFDDGQIAGLVAMRKAGTWTVLAPANKPKPFKSASGKGEARLSQHVRGDTVEDLIRDWLAAISNPAQGEKQLAPETIESYAKAADVVAFKREDRAAAKARRASAAAAVLLGLPAPERARELFAVKPVRVIGVPELKQFYLHLKLARGHHMALAATAAFSAAWTWGKQSTRWRLGPNPRHELELDRPPGRLVIYSAEEIAARISAGDAIGKHAVGDATLLGLLIGQRQKDRMAMTPDLLDARHNIRQSKTGMVVEVKQTPRLKQRLAEAALRVTALNLKTGLRPKTIVVNERTGWSYDKTSYRHDYAEVTRATVHGVVTLDGVATIADPKILGEDFAIRLHNSLIWICRPCPSAAGKTDKDLRKTCVTWLYRAGNDLQAIADVTGHTYKAVQTIVHHYLARDRQRADAAIDRLVDWMAKEGMAV